MRALLLLMAMLPLRADDARAILERLIPAEKHNAELARQYTSREETTWLTYDKHGQPQKTRSETHEVIFVEGVEYRKLIARNGKPLSAREAARVAEEMRETAAERRRHPQYAPGGSIGLGGARADLGSLAELLTLFDNRLAGEEEVNGRKAWVIESVPRAAHVPASPHEKDIFAFHKKLWIDQAENVVLRMVATVEPEGLYSPAGELLAAPGSTIRFENEKIDPQVWEQVSIVLDVERQEGDTIRPWGRTEYRYSRFQKFDVESTVTAEPPK
jgi:hypothetical protein